ncbi:MAG: SpaA isopeptide-forming pilin-related protein, partial [Bulleidia sp.]|nr:SpaA isopeptide-forming pilin-related protein [Bulleidia sp.]
HKVTVKPGTYTLHEDLSPVGYKIAKDITFDVDIEGKVTVNGKKVDQVVMVDEDQTYDIAISKQDITNNKELPGAKLSLKDTKTNKVVETWTSASEAHVVTVVPSTYELSEVASPNGYEIAEKITFTVERDGTITIDGKKVETVIMQDQPTKPTVDTSDHNNIVFFGITGVISLGLAFMMLLTRKKIH